MTPTSEFLQHVEAHWLTLTDEQRAEATAKCAERAAKVQARVTFASLESPDAIQRETVVCDPEAIPAMYAATGCRVIEVETVTA